MTLLLSFLLLLFGYTTAQFPYFGKCPSPDVQPDFDMNRFLGTWYEVQRTMSFLQIGSRCTQTNYSKSEYEDGSYEVINEGRGPILKLKKSVRLIATIPDEKEPAKMVLRLSDLSVHGNYWVLATDYDNYAIVWSCNHVWLTLQYARTENLWVYSRKRSFSDEIQEEVNRKLEEIKHIKVKKLLRNVSQNGCEDDDNDTTPGPDDNETE